MTLSLTQNAFAATELFYDDGTAETGSSSFAGSMLGVKFSLPAGWSAAKLLTARYYIYGAPNTFRVHIYLPALFSLPLTDLIPPLDVTPSATGWFSVDLSSYGLVVSEDFYIALEFLVDGQPFLGHDTSSPNAGHSYYGQVSTGFYQNAALNLMVRVEVDQVIDFAVGGVITPVNVLDVLSPYLALIGLFGVVTAAVAIRKRRA